MEAAQSLVNRVITEAGDSDSDRLTHAMRLAIARVPKAEEVSRFSELLEAARTYYAANEADAKTLTARHATKGLSPSENAAWIATVRMILNLDEFIVRG